MFFYLWCSAGVFLIHALAMRKNGFLIPRNKIPPVQSTFMSCPSFRGFTVHKGESLCEMHEGASSRNPFFASATRGSEIRTVRKNADNPYFFRTRLSAFPKTILFYADDPYSQTNTQRRQVQRSAMHDIFMNRRARV